MRAGIATALIAMVLAGCGGAEPHAAAVKQPLDCGDAQQQIRQAIREHPEALTDRAREMVARGMLADEKDDGAVACMYADDVDVFTTP